MDEIKTASSAPSELSELRARCNQLQQLVSSLLLISIVISGTLSVFLLRQWRFTSTELNAVTPAALQMIADYTNNTAALSDLVRKLAEYGRTHPDYAPISARYRLNDYLPKPGTASVTSSLPNAGTGAPSSKH